MKSLVFGTVFLFICSCNAYQQTAEYSMGEAVFTLTACNKNKAINTIEFFIDSKPFYHFDIYQFDFNNVHRDAKIISGSISDLIKIYNGYSYGSITYGYLRVNCVMYSNSDTGQYSLLQFADFNLGGGVASQNLRKIFERSVAQVDNK